MYIEHIHALPHIKQPRERDIYFDGLTQIEAKQTAHTNEIIV